MTAEPADSRPTNLFYEFFRSEAAGGALLVVCACAALALANSRWAAAYDHVLATTIERAVRHGGTVEQIERRDYSLFGQGGCSGAAGRDGWGMPGVSAEGGTGWAEGTSGSNPENADGKRTPDRIASTRPRNPGGRGAIESSPRSSTDR